MPAEVIIVSGFLGAGKTTLIQKLLDDQFINKKVVLIVNDFGAVSVDAALLRMSGFEVKELISGCICCNLAGDFVAALTAVLDQFHPDIVFIEPSGVSKLSDIVKACSSPLLLSRIKVKIKITVVDATRCLMFVNRFGAFYKDQIENADVILVSHIEKEENSAVQIIRILKSLNAQAEIVSLPLNQIRAGMFLEAYFNRSEISDSKEHHIKENNGHHHDAHDIFDEFTIQPFHCFTLKEWETRFERLELNVYGEVLRAKGIVVGSDGYLNMQYIPGDIQITKVLSIGNALTFIGRNLNKLALTDLFS